MINLNGIVVSLFDTLLAQLILYCQLGLRDNADELEHILDGYSTKSFKGSLLRSHAHLFGESVHL